MEEKIQNTPSPNKEFDLKSHLLTVREPKCTRCRNHGLISKMKGHKGNCLYMLCMCLKCILVEERRRISRQQIRLRRANVDFQKFLEGSNRTSPSGHQTNVSPNNHISNEPNTLCSPMSWPLNFSVVPPPNVRIPTSCNLNSGTSMVPESHGANMYYSPNKLADFPPPYAHTPTGYPLTAPPSQNLSYKHFNGGASSMYGRPCVFNPVGYNLNPINQRMANNRLGTCQVSHYLSNWPSNKTRDMPTDLTERNSAEACALANDNRK